MQRFTWTISNYSVKEKKCSDADIYTTLTWNDHGYRLCFVLATNKSLASLYNIIHEGNKKLYDIAAS